MVNIENVRKVIKKIADEENFFSMEAWGIYNNDIEYLSGIEFYDRFGAAKPSCETPACIGGWGEFILKEENKIKDEFISSNDVGEWLGLNEDAYDALFYPKHKTYVEITRQEAIDVLENLIITGTVDWTAKAEN